VNVFYIIKKKKESVYNIYIKLNAPPCDRIDDEDDNMMMKI